jgi:nicotinamide-nucleotide amidase
MNIGIISIGDEILIGQVLNTNAAWIAEQLSNEGFSVSIMIASGDKTDDIIQAFRQGFAAADILLVTGGLGPTSDDRTREALCSFYECKMKTDPASVEIIKDLLNRRGLPVTDINLKQAEIPNISEAIPNPLGTSPGMWAEQEGKTLVAMPGVPFEMKYMFSKQVLPKLKEKFPPENILCRNILTCGLGESFLSEHIKEWEENLPADFSLAYLPQPGIIKLRLTAKGSNVKKLEKALEKEVDKLCDLIPELVFGFDDDTLEGVIGELFAEHQLTLASAESCTGGYIAHLITSVPGASRYYKGTVVAYENFIKINELNVQRSVLEQFGAVSEEVVMLMAKGIRRKFKPDYCVAVSGIAGPDGGSASKPVGTMWIAVAGPNGIKTRKETFSGDRHRNIQRASIAALNFLRLEVEHDLESEPAAETE